MNAIVVPRRTPSNDRFFGTTNKTPEQISERDVFAFAQRAVPLKVEEAERTEVGRVAASRYERLAAGDLAGVNVVPCEVVGDPLKPLGRKSCLRRRQLH